MPLSVEQIARLSLLLDEALELDEAARKRWFDALAPENQDLAVNLRAGLFPGEKTRAVMGQLDTIPKLGGEGAGSTDPGAVGTLSAGARIGPYELIRRLGAGGMAEVWLARRVDGAYERSVALKLPVRLQQREDLARRFAHERDILAGLEHIHIARFYDAGVTAEGLPYLAMEYVPGEPLTTWCDKRTLPLQGRIELFLNVLNAVHFAHSRQVVHRDIKPSNVLVTESGDVRLLDFGVAKMLADVNGPKTQLTEIYGRALTPDYASPEHLMGDTTEVASDIYSLGVMLYELLAGNRPYRRATARPGTAPDQLLTDESVRPPSTLLSADAGSARAVTQKKLAQRLRGDLDAIVLKALAPNPQERYGSAQDMATDLRRYLAGDPVQARPDRFGYRTGKFLLRHRSAVAMGAVVALGLAATVFNRTQDRAPQAAGEAAATATEFVAPEKSIAVLPFVDVSVTKDQEFFSDGLADELLHILGRIPDLRVAARTSAFSFKGKSDDIQTIARKLLVANVLEGSVRRVGNSMRISVQLVKAVDGYQVWSQTYDRKVDDIFKVQEEIATAVAKSLKASLVPGTIPKAEIATGKDSYFQFLRARELMYRTGDYGKVAEQLEQICNADPGFAPAWAELSFVRSEVASNTNDRNEKHWDDARTMAQKAIAMDPRFPGGHVSLAKIYMYHDWNWSGAQAELRQALALEPGNWAALQFSALLSRYLANYDESFDFLRRALAVDPLNGFSYGLLATTNLKAGRLDATQEALNRVKSIFPGNKHFIHEFGGNLEMARGQYAEALAEFEQIRHEDALYGLVVANFALGRRAQSDALLAEYEKSHADDDALGIAAAHAYREEEDQAMSWLERAYRQHEGLSDLKGEPSFKKYWATPRYEAILRKLNLLADFR